MVEILRVSQEAAIQVSGRGEEPLSPTTQETIMTMQFERYTINGRLSLGILFSLFIPSVSLQKGVIRASVKALNSGTTSCVGQTAVFVYC